MPTDSDLLDQTFFSRFEPGVSSTDATDALAQKNPREAGLS